MRKYIHLIPLLVLASLLVSCAQASQAPAVVETSYNTVATIKDIMDSLVDPSADYIWESIATVVSSEGVIEKAPKNDEEWKEERRHAIALVEAANLLKMPGRHVAKAGEKSENPGIELGPEEIEALIVKDRNAFIKLAEDFQDTAIKQLKAVDDKNIGALLEVGGDLDAKCENCHKTYWYPNDPAFKNEAPVAEKK